ncbi:MAG: hypothetical protein ACPG3S_02680 [Schleiferiaceae bacterium]
MKRTPFLGPILWRPTIVIAIFLAQNQPLKAEKQTIRDYLVRNSMLSTITQLGRESIDTSDFSWIQNDRFTQASWPEDSITFGLGLQNQPALSSVAPLSIHADTVHFEWKTTGKYSAVYQASLFIDSAFKSTYMPCCDQAFTGTSLAPQLTLLKAGMPLVVNHMPKSSHYPIYLVGEGTLKSTGAQGWFFYPPNLYASNKPLTMVGKGPHKVYWLGADHPDICPGQQLYFEEELLGTAREGFTDTISMDAHFDILGRPSSNMEAVELRKTGRKWRKVIKVK